MDERLTFGQYLKRQRKEQDLTQSALAEQAGCSIDTVKKIESGVLRPSRQLAELLATALQIEAAEQDAFVRLSRAALPARDGARHEPAPERAEVAPPSPAEAPAPAAPSPHMPSPAASLPIPPTSLVGREREIEAVDALLRREDVRLLTLTGPPGIGKTRLALQVAGEMAGHFRHGAPFVSLAPIVDPGLVVSQIAQALGVREGRDQPLIETLKAYLRDKQMLLVLDNFEQVATAAPHVTEILAAAPDVRVLATSRARLHVRGEHEMPVPALSMPDPEQLPPTEQLTEYEAVRLFTERAGAISPDFGITAENGPVVAEICHRLDGLPLAIELAAARIKILPPQAMLARLQNRLKLLTSGEQDLPARQRTLRGAIEWSYDLLEEEEKKLFRRLAVFQGSRTLEALEAVCAVGVGGRGSGAGNESAPTALSIDILDGVASLVDKSLLRQGAGTEGEPRFTMLQTLHEYAREKLEESGEADQVQSAHARFFLALAERAAPYLKSARQQEWLLRLEQDHDNFRTALWWCLCPPNEAPGAVERIEAGLKLASTLSWFWTRHSHMAEGRKWIEIALESAQPLPAIRQGPASADALYGAGVIAYLQGDQETAARMLQESYSIYSRLGVKQGIADSLVYLGVVKGYLRRDVAEGRPLLEESVKLHREIGDAWGLAMAISFLGFLPLVEGEYAKARVLFEEALPLFEATGDKWAIGWVKVITGEATRCQGDYATARSLYEQSLVLHREMGDKHSIAIATNNLGYMTMYLGDFDRSSAYFHESTRLMAEMGSKGRMLSCIAGFAALARARGQSQRAARLFGAAEAQAEAQHAGFEPSELLEFQRNVAALREAMDKTAFSAAWATGRAMTWDETVAYALAEAADPVEADSLISRR